MRTEMPLLPVDERVKSFKEIELGYSLEQAIKEAGRCLQCKNPVCIEGCPAKVDCKAFIEQVMLGEFDKALEIIEEKNPLASFTGRVCAEEAQCEGACVLAKKNWKGLFQSTGKTCGSQAKATGKRLRLLEAGRQEWRPQ